MIHMKNSFECTKQYALISQFVLFPISLIGSTVQQEFEAY